MSGLAVHMLRVVWTSGLGICPKTCFSNDAANTIGASQMASNLYFNVKLF